MVATTENARTLPLMNSVSGREENKEGRKGEWEREKKEERMEGGRKEGERRGEREGGKRKERLLLNKISKVLLF